MKTTYSELALARESAAHLAETRRQVGEDVSFVL